MVPELPEDAMAVDDEVGEEDAADVAARKKAEAQARLEAELKRRTQVGKLIFEMMMEEDA